MNIQNNNLTLPFTRKPNEFITRTLESHVYCWNIIISYLKSIVVIVMITCKDVCERNISEWQSLFICIRKTIFYSIYLYAIILVSTWLGGRCLGKIRWSDILQICKFMGYFSHSLIWGWDFVLQTRPLTFCMFVCFFLYVCSFRGVDEWVEQGGDRPHPLLNFK